MNKEDYDKLSTFEKIEFDIAMITYGYSDLKSAEDAEKARELELYKETLKEKCNAIDKAIEKIDIILAIQEQQKGTIIPTKYNEIKKILEEKNKEWSNE